MTSPQLIRISQHADANRIAGARTVPAPFFKLQQSNEPVYARIINAMKKSDPLLLEEIASALERIPKEKQWHFVGRGIVRMLESTREASTQDFGKIISTVVENMLSSDPGFLPDFTLKYFSCGQRIPCEMTYSYFWDAFKDGSLVKASFKDGRGEKQLFIKGFWSDTGHILAMEPKESTIAVHSLYMFNGCIEEIYYCETLDPSLASHRPHLLDAIKSKLKGGISSPSPSSPLPQHQEALPSQSADPSA